MATGGGASVQRLQDEIAMKRLGEPTKGDLEQITPQRGEVAIKPILRAGNGTRTTCSGGSWRLVNNTAIDSGCVLPLVTSNEEIVADNDPNGGLLMLQSSGSVAKADGRGETMLQLLSNHVETGEQLILKTSTGQGGTTLAKHSHLDLIGSGFLSNHGVIPVQDHENPRCLIRGKPGFEIPCKVVQSLWYLPMCNWGGGCNACDKCDEVKKRNCWASDGTIEPHVETDNVRFAPLPVRTKPACSCFANGAACLDDCEDVHWVTHLGVSRRVKRKEMVGNTRESFLSFFGEKGRDQSVTAASQAHKIKEQRMVRRARQMERRATTSDGEQANLGTALIRDEFGDDIMTVLERDREAERRSASVGGEHGENCLNFQPSDTRPPRTSPTWTTTPVNDIKGHTPDVLKDMVEQEERAQDQYRQGVRARPSKSPAPIVPRNGGQVKLQQAHHRLGCTSKRVILATSSCVKNLTVTHKEWDHCNCDVCMSNKPHRPRESTRARTERDHEQPIEAFKKVTIDFKGRMRRKSWNGHLWFLVIVCRMTDAIYPGFSGRKADAPQLMKNFLKWTKTKNLKVGVVSSDSDTCFLSVEFRKILEDAGIEQRLYLRSHRGHHAERAILTTLKRASSILIHAMCSDLMWSDAVHFSVMIHNRLVNPDHWRKENRLKTRLELCTGKVPDFKYWFTPLCTVFVIHHGFRYGHFRPTVLAGSWLNLGPSEVVDGAHRVFNTVTREVRVSSHVWFQESMDNRRDALTNFDMNLFPNLKRMSAGQLKVHMTKEERQALKLRELYCNPATEPNGVIKLEGDVLVEYKSPNLESNHEDIIEQEGTHDHDEVFQPGSAETTSNSSQTEETSTDKIESQNGQAQEVNRQKDSSEADNETNQHKEASEAGDGNPASETLRHKESSEVDSEEYKGGVYINDPNDKNEIDHLVDSDPDSEEETVEDEVSYTDEEYKQLVEAKGLKRMKRLDDKQIREAQAENLNQSVEMQLEGDDDGVTVQEFLQQTDTTLPSTPSDLSPDDIANRKHRRRSRKRNLGDLTSEEKLSLKEILEQLPEGRHQLTHREKQALQYAYDNDLEIVWLVNENPKRRKSRDKFQLYWNDGENDIVEAKKNKMTWADYLNDFEKGFFRVSPKALDSLPKLAAALLNPIEIEDMGNTHNPSLAAALHDAPILDKNARVILVNMDKSKYRRKDLNGITGKVLNFDVDNKRYLVKLDDQKAGNMTVTLRGTNLVEDQLVPSLSAREVAETRPTAPPPALVAALINSEKTRHRRDTLTTIKALRERIRILQMELADLEPLTTLNLYETMAQAYQTSILKAYDVYCPKDLKTAMSCSDCEDWKKSIRKEINDLANMDTWTVVPRSTAMNENKNVLKSGLIFKVKEDGDGNFTKRKTRFVCKGYSEVYGQDYFNIRSGVVDYSSARMLIALAAAEGAELWTYDVRNAFVSTEVPEGEHFYCEAPQDVNDNELFGDMFTLPDGSKGILKCTKCLYGSKNSPRRFWQKLQRTLEKGGFAATVQDQCVLVCGRTRHGGGTLRVAMWVDDLLVTTTSSADKTWIDNLLQESFDLSDESGIEPTSLYLGMKISRDYKLMTITLSTPALIDSLIKDLETKGHLGVHAAPKTHPMSGTKLVALEDKSKALNESAYPYRNVVGTCLHLSRTTRPDITLAVSELSSYLTCYGDQHVNAANWLVLYLKGTKSLGITYHGNLPAHLKNKLITFSDADWAGDTVTRKSRTGYTLQLNLGPIEWYSKGQPIQSTSSCMSETIAAVEAAKAIIAARLLLFELGYRQPGSSRLYVDNEATCLNANGTNQSKRSKHFQIRTELLRVYTELGRVHVFKVHTDKNISDLHTKALLNDKFTDMRDIMMGIKADLDLLHYS